MGANNVNGWRLKQPFQADARAGDIPKVRGGACFNHRIKNHKLGVQTLYLYTPESDVFNARLGLQVNEKAKYLGYSVTIMEKLIVL